MVPNSLGYPVRLAAGSGTSSPKLRGSTDNADAFTWSRQCNFRKRERLKRQQQAGFNNMTSAGGRGSGSFAMR
jgi:hypothetical protein